MPVPTLKETPESRAETFIPPGYTLIYKTTGEQDNLLVATAADLQVPRFVIRPTGTLGMNSLNIDPDGFAQYLITATYNELSPESLDVLQTTFSFDTQGATINIKAAKQHVNTFDKTGLLTGNFHRSAIGVKGDGDVEGADIIVPALKLTYGIKYPEGVVTEDYARSMAGFTGRTNDDRWQGFATGELLFIGGSGSDGTDTEATISLNFVGSPNESNFSIGDIVGIVKDGHHLAWVEFEDDVEDGSPIRAPKRVHIERVYDQLSFSGAFGFGDIA